MVEINVVVAYGCLFPSIAKSVRERKHIFAGHVIKGLQSTGGIKKMLSEDYQEIISQLEEFIEGVVNSVSRFITGLFPK